MMWSLLVLLLSLAAVCGFGALPQDTYDDEFLRDVGDDKTRVTVTTEGVDDFKDAWKNREPREYCPVAGSSICYTEICIPGTNTCKMPNPRKNNFDDEGNANIGYFKGGVWTARPIMAISNHNQCENLEKLDHCMDALKKPTFIGENKCESLGEKLCGSGNDAYRQSGKYGYELCGWDKFDGKCRSCGLAFKCHPVCHEANAQDGKSTHFDWPSPPPPPSPSPPGRRLEDEADAEHRRKMRDLYNQQVTSRMRKLAAACDINKPNCKLPPGAGFGQCDACPAELSTTQSTSWDEITERKEKLTEKDYKCAPGISGMYINTTVNKGSEEDCTVNPSGQCLPVGNFRIETISCDLGYAKYDMEKNTCPGNSKAFDSSGQVVATGDFCDLTFVAPAELDGESVTSDKVKDHIRKHLPSLEAGTVDPTPEEIADVENGLGIPGRWMLTVETVQFGNTPDTLRDIYVPSQWSKDHFGIGYKTFHPTEGSHKGGGGCKCTTTYTPDAMDVAYGRSFANPGNSRNALTQSKSCKAQYTASVNPRLAAASLDTVKINGISYVDCFSARDAETLENAAGVPAGKYSVPSQDMEVAAGGKARTSADATAECMPDAEKDITLISRTIATTRGNLRLSKMTCNLQIQVKSEDGRVGRIDREQDGDCLCSPPTTTEGLNRGRSIDGDIIADCMETQPMTFDATPDNDVVVTNKKVVRGDMDIEEPEEIILEDTSESAICEKLDEMKDLTALHPDTPWCNKYGKAGKEVCESYFFTGTSGHIYPCKYDADKKNKKGKSTPCTWAPKDQTLCCSHFCGALKSKTNLNPNNNGGKPWCGKTSETSKSVCESHYWTGGDLRSYSCLFDTARQEKGLAPCRLSLGDACACDYEAVDDPDAPIDVQKSWLDSDY